MNRKPVKFTLQLIVATAMLADVPDAQAVITDRLRRMARHKLREFNKRTMGWAVELGPLCYSRRPGAAWHIRDSVTAYASGALVPIGMLKQADNTPKPAYKEAFKRGVAVAGMSK